MLKYIVRRLRTSKRDRLIVIDTDMVTERGLETVLNVPTCSVIAAVKFVKDQPDDLPFSVVGLEDLKCTLFSLTVNKHSSTARVVVYLMKGGRHEASITNEVEAVIT